MTEYYEEQLDINTARIVEIEKNLSIMHENIMIVSDQLKNMQIYLIKLVKNQAELSKRVSQWPYIAVSTNYEDGDESQ